jgi:transcriptional regulator with XRE-family HTH domain
MPDRERAADRGSRQARGDLAAIGTELRTARVMAGKTLADVGRSVGMSYSQVGRIERAALPSVTLGQLARIGAVVGLDVRVRAFPGATPLRDAAQIALLDRLRIRLGANLTMRTEVPLPIEGDLRAWDAVIAAFEPIADPLHVEAETRLYDAQGQLRRIALKARDAAGEHQRHVSGATESGPFVVGRGTASGRLCSRVRVRPEGARFVQDVTIEELELDTTDSPVIRCTFRRWSGVPGSDLACPANDVAGSDIEADSGSDMVITCTSKR